MPPKSMESSKNPTKKRGKKNLPFTPNQSNLLHKIYYDPKNPAGYGSAQKLIDRTHLSPSVVQAWLRHQPTYTLHRPKRVRLRAHYSYRVYRPRLQYQADLVDYIKYSEKNKGYKYMLVVIDVFSKRAWSVPLKTKSGAEVAEALDKILSPPPKRLQVDQGREFFNQHVARMLKKKGIELFSIYSQNKAAVVERLNRTIKDKLERIFTAENSKNWISHLDDVIEAYNNSKHRTIGMAPNQVNESNIEEVTANILKSQRRTNPKRRQAILPLNTRVRISRDKGVFGRGYEANWSTEEFFVESARETPGGGPPMYTLRDAQGEILKGAFYPQEVQKVDRKEEVYQIDDILKRRTRRGKKEIFVHWQGYPVSMNSWIPEAALQALGPIRQN